LINKNNKILFYLVIKIDTMEDAKLEQIIKDSKFLKEVSKELYLTRLRAIQEKIYKGTLHEIMLNPDIFEEKIRTYAENTAGKVYEHLNDHTIEGYYSAVLAVFIHSNLKQEMYEEYNKWQLNQNIYRRCNDKKYKWNQPTERQKAAYIDFEEIKRIRDNLNPGLDRLLLVMYTEIPPQRSDYDSIRIYYGRVPDDNKYS